MNHEPTIGLEIHAELKTRTKMFCDSLNDPSESHPNANVCPVCLGHPGTLPTINKQAVEYVIKVGLALGGKINPVTKFDRKNYFYPDLPKGYQISQYDLPLVVGGELNGVRIRRIHLEEDTGTLVHDRRGPSASSGRPASLVDFNRAGVPLMELVTEPDLKSSGEVAAFAKELQLILRYLEVSDADMERGEMRVEANVSLGRMADGEAQMGTKVEVKNINSFRFAKEAVEYEIKRQAEVLDGGGKIAQETRGWDENKKKTVSQRSKEEAHDYRYFPEPDLPPFETGVFDLEKLRAEMPELPQAKRKRLRKELDELKLTEISDKQIAALVADKKMAEYFEEMASEVRSLCSQDFPKPADASYGTFAEYPNFLRNVTDRGYNYLTENLPNYAKYKGVTPESIYENFGPEKLASFVYHVEFGLPGFHGNDVRNRENVEEILERLLDAKLSGAQIRAIFNRMLETREELGAVLQSEEFKPVSDEAELEKVVGQVIEENPNAVADYKGGKAQALQFLVGKGMQKARGKANPEALRRIFSEKLP